MSLVCRVMKHFDIFATSVGLMSATTRKPACGTMSMEKHD